jgi:hypothetical protein
MALPSNLTFAEMYERFLVEPLFRPFAENSWAATSLRRAWR